ncbi:MAG: T9SS type A sorting domain-containing protein [Bacteroidota bacterium]
MKCLNQVLFIVMIAIYSPAVLLAQLDVSITDCNNVNALFTKEITAKDYHFWLEKQIAPGIWRAQQKEASKVRQMIYKDLQAGIYRVGLVYKEVHIHSYMAKKSHVHEVLLKEMSEPFEIIPDCFLDKREMRSANISVYPNPSNGLLHTRLPNYRPEENVVLSITDMAGKLRYQGAITNTTQTIDVHALDQGLFFVQIHIDKQVIYHSKLALIKR